MRARLGAAIAALCVTMPAWGGEDGAYVTGSLAWFSSDRYEILGSMAAELPIAAPPGWRVFFGAELLTAIEGATNFTFTVGQIDYAARIGARHALLRGGAIEVFAAESGRQTVDDLGTARVRAAGAAWETRGMRDAFAEDGWAGRLALGAVWESKGVDADATASGSLRWMRRLGREKTIAAGFDARVDALLGHDHGADLLAGPRVDFDLGGNRRFGLYTAWLESDNPLGLGIDGLLAGFDLAQGPLRGERLVPPRISGLAAAGGGDAGRPVGELDLRVDSPPFLGDLYAEIEVDAHVNASDLFYLYDLGLAHPFASQWRAGGFFYHRSNHLLNRPNATVTSINVLEAGIETSGWRGATPGVPLGHAGAIDLLARAGWLIDSAFGEDEAWHARGGVRYAAPAWGAVRLYLSAEAERGDVASSAFSVGLLLPRSWDVRVEQAHDEQLFAADDRGLYAVATLRY